MGGKQSRPIMRIRHDSVSGEDKQHTHASEENKMTVQEIEDQLVSILQSMPNDLIQEFYFNRLKIKTVKGYESAKTHIEAMDEKTDAGLKFILTELLDYLKHKNKNEGDPFSQDSKQTPTQKNQNDQPAETQDSPQEESEEIYHFGFDTIEDYSGGEINSENLSEYMHEKIQKTIMYLEDLLRRIKRCEERLDLSGEAVKALTDRVSGLEDLKKDLPDIIAAQIISIVTDMGIPSGQGASPSPPMGSFEIKDQTKNETRNVEGIFPEEWNRILQLATARENILLVGPTGCGKTYIAEMVAKAIGLQDYSISCSEGMSENELKGWLLPLGEKGEWVYVPSDFVTAYENGGVFILDEIDASDPNVLTWLNKAIGGKSFNLAIRKGNTLVKRHKDFVLIGCANTMGAGADMVYVGRNQLDGATRDRFKAGIIPMDYSSQVEEKIINQDVLLWGGYIRKALKSLKDQAHHMSTRTMLSFSNMLDHHGWKNKDWEKAYFADWSESDKARIFNVIKDQIRSDIEAEQQKVRGKA